MVRYRAGAQSVKPGGTAGRSFDPLSQQTQLGQGFLYAPSRDRKGEYP